MKKTLFFLTFTICSLQARTVQLRNNVCMPKAQAMTIHHSLQELWQSDDLNQRAAFLCLHEACLTSNPQRGRQHARWLNKHHLLDAHGIIFPSVCAVALSSYERAEDDFATRPYGSWCPLQQRTRKLSWFKTTIFDECQDC